MRISSKGRYALAASIYLAQKYNREEYISVINISDELHISKIYLEQIFSMMKKRGILNAIKGSQGGYRLAAPPNEISVYDVLSVMESGMFEPTASTLEDKRPEIESVMVHSVFDKLDDTVSNSLKEKNLYDLAVEVQKHKGDDGFMYYI